MLSLYYLTIFFTGASLVSFLTVVAQDYPDPKHRSVRRSHCDHCHCPLSWTHIIPILSYLSTFGKTHCCNRPIKSLYPISETSGGIFLILFVVEHIDLRFIVPIFISLTLFSMMDLRDGYIYPIFYPILLPSFLVNLNQLHWLTGIMTWTILYLFFKLGPGIGLGDVELISLLAILFHMQIITIGVSLACALCLLHYLWDKKRSFRFIPYLTLGIGITYLIFNWSN